MSPRRTNTAHCNSNKPHNAIPNMLPQPTPLPTRQTTPKQSTIWNFIQRKISPPTTSDLPPTQQPLNSTPATHASNTPLEIQDDASLPTTSAHNISQLTPPATPTNPAAQAPPPTSNNNEPHQTTIPDTLQPETPRQNHPWGDAWVLDQPHSWFRVLSKNTGTINLSNSDMAAITTEITQLGASVMAIQEPNTHWNVEAIHQLYTQCRSVAPHITIATSSSVDSDSPGYQPGGTMILALDPWTSRVVQRGNDVILGRWSFLEFMGKSDKRLIVVSGYRVCNQKFDATSNTTSAQQIRLLQTQGITNPKPRRIFIDDLISQVLLWRNANKEVLICMDANENVDDPKADISRLFTATDLMDLHTQRYPSLRKTSNPPKG